MTNCQKDGILQRAFDACAKEQAQEQAKNTIWFASHQTDGELFCYYEAVDPAAMVAAVQKYGHFRVRVIEPGKLYSTVHHKGVNGLVKKVSKPALVNFEPYGELPCITWFEESKQ